MIEKCLTFLFKGEEIQFKLRYRVDNWYKPNSAISRLGMKNSWLAIYDNRKSAVTIGSAMPHWYIPFGVLFEMIYHGNFFVELIEQITDGSIKIVNDEHRCIAVERFMLLLTKCHAKYINARIELYESLLNSRYRPIPEKQMIEALEVLQELATLEKL